MAVGPRPRFDDLLVGRASAVAQLLAAGAGRSPWVRATSPTPIR